MTFEDINGGRITDWLRSHKDSALTGETFNIPWRTGIKKEEVIILPLKFLEYSFHNIRVEFQFINEIQTEGDYDYENEEHRNLFATKFESWLNKKGMEDLGKDIINIGQLTPGIITHGGMVVDGNRRLAVLKKIAVKHEEGECPNIKLGYMKVVRLEAGTDLKTLLQLQTLIQMRKPFTEKYKPINFLLGIRKMQQTGFTDKEIQNYLGLKSLKAVQNRKFVLNLIDDFLTRNNIQDRYYLIDKLNIVDIFNEIKNADQFIAKADLTPEQEINAKHLNKEVSFRLLSYNLEPEMREEGFVAGTRERIRPLKKSLAKPENHQFFEVLLQKGQTFEEKKEFYAKTVQKMHEEDMETKRVDLVEVAQKILEKIDSLNEGLDDPDQQFNAAALKKKVMKAGKNIVILSRKLFGR